MRPRDLLLAVLVPLIWGVNFVFVDRGLDDMPPFAFVALRFVLVCIPAIFFVKRPGVGFWPVVWIGMSISAAQFGLLFLGMHLGVPAGLAPLVLQAQVLFTVLLAALTLKEIPTRWQLLGIGVGAVGLLVVAIGRGQVAPVLPLLIVIAAALAWAIGNVLTRRVKAASGLSLVVWSGLVVPVPMLAMSLIFEGHDVIARVAHDLTWWGVAGVAFTAYAASLLGYGMWNTLLARYPASMVGPFAMLVPVIGFLAAWVVLDELPTTVEVIGGVLLLAGVAATALLGRRTRPAPADTVPAESPGPPAATDTATPTR
ncbi:EamA family transporter [Nakamurella leprariae]|uniref:EamA family transporter n=1 Tax=Nakamurella leprariae TaxID=2803911 RepID=A0A938YFA6_9ACTN|nr:EamA family transporter [Nakamurella leprariae]MBM9468523.1 EamA family transporter [Nakamurella leprariae]